jgi:hypothetical protein
VAGRLDKQAGSALGALLGRRASADQDAAGRSLLLALVRLNALGALSFALGDAVHGDDTVAEPSTVGKPLGPEGMARGEGLPGGGRVDLDGVGAVVGVDALGTPAYNMGQSVCIPGDSE